MCHQDVPGSPRDGKRPYSGEGAPPNAKDVPVTAEEGSGWPGALLAVCPPVADHACWQGPRFASSVHRMCALQAAEQPVTGYPQSALGTSAAGDPRGLWYRVRAAAGDE